MKKLQLQEELPNLSKLWQTFLQIEMMIAPREASRPDYRRRSKILAAYHAVGQRFVSTADIAAETGESHATVRDVMSRAAALGLFEVQEADGVYAKPKYRPNLGNIAYLMGARQFLLDYQKCDPVALLGFITFQGANLWELFAAERNGVLPYSEIKFTASSRPQMLLYARLKSKGTCITVEGKAFVCPDAGKIIEYILNI